jgi:hypothetical protein
MSDTKLIPLQNWPEHQPWPPVGGLRHLIAHAPENGLEQAGAIIRVGRRVLVDEARFIEWARARGRKGAR